MKRFRPSPRTVVAAAFVVSSILTACGGGGEVSKDDCKIIEPSGPGVTELTIKAKDMSFSESCVEVQPGRVSITFVNEDGKVPHNLRVKGGGINESTALQAGPFTEVLELELDTPGDHPFSCDPHSNMRGVIVVADPTRTADTEPAS